MEKTFFVSIIVWLIVCEGQRDSGCAEEETCVGRDTCAFYNSELAKLKKLIRGSSEHRLSRIYAKYIVLLNVIL